MIQLTILNGKMAGAHQVARHFPFRIGRSAGSDLCVQDEGVWDQHLEVCFQKQHGFTLSVKANAFAAINGQTVQEATLCNGDLIELGALQLRFALSPTRQRQLGWREFLTWAALAALCLGQVMLIYQLLG